MAKGENCLIAVAGAATAVTNGAIAGIIDEIGQGSDIADVYGAPAGLLGVIEGKVNDLGAQKRKVIEGLRRTPGSLLSGRTRATTDTDGAAVVAALKERQIGTVFLLGGLAALSQARFALSAAEAANYELAVLVLPLSAENEVGVGDHNSGFGSAARFAALAVRDAGRAAQSGEEPVLVIEFGGQSNGWLAATTALARDAQNPAPHVILTPEKPINAETLVDDVRRATQKYGYAVVVTSEGAKDGAGNSLAAPDLMALLSEKLGLPARYDRLTASSRVSGANIARADGDEAYALGSLVVRLADDGVSGYVVSLTRDPHVEGKGERGYKVIEGTKRLEEVADAARALPGEYLSETGTGVSDSFVEWAKPLIGGALPDYTALG